MHNKMKKRLNIPLLNGADWQQALLEQGTPFSVDQVNWPDAFPTAPSCRGRIGRTPEALAIHWAVSGADLRVQNLQDGGRIWEDSCCELFVLLPASGQSDKPSSKAPDYINIECNAAGILLGACGPDRHARRPLPQEMLSQIVRVADIQGPCEEVGGRWEWTLTLLIPYTVLGLDANHLPVQLEGNIYKCGDKTAHPHFLSWSPVETPNPDFHRPEFFGTFILP